MIYRMFLVHKALAGSLKKYIAPVFLFTGLFFLHIMVSFFMMLDYLFFPSLWKKKVERPILIVGNPRSGTTFLQRFLVDNGFGTGSRLWKLMYASLTLQTLLKPFLPIMEKVSPAKHHAKAAHKTSLNAIETDDPMLAFRYFDGFFVYSFFLSWSKNDYMDMFDPEIRDTSKRDFNWFEKVWRRILVGEKKDRFVGKLFSLGVRLPAFLKRFPDARILYTARDPLATVPSGMSLVTGVMDGMYGFWKLPEETRNNFLKRLYKALLHLTMRFHRDWVSGAIDRNKVKVVTYDRLMQDFDTLMTETVEFLGVPMTPELEAEIKKTAEKQRAFKSEHKYDLAKFGLTEEQIRTDYAEFYKTFFN